MVSRVLAPGLASFFLIALVPLAIGACGGEGAKAPATAPVPSAVPVSSRPADGAKTAPVPPARRDDVEVLGPPHTFGFDDMIAMRRIEQLTASPDGTKIAYTIKTSDVAANKSAKDIWIQNVDGTGARRLTDHPGADHSPRFAPDGKSVIFLSDRGGTTQVWRVALEGSETTQVTSLPIDVAGMQPFGDGKRLALILEVYPDATTLEETRDRDKARAKDPSHVRAFDALPVRHWDAWDDGKTESRLRLERGQVAS